MRQTLLTGIAALLAISAACGPAQSAAGGPTVSCRAEYDLCRRVRASPPTHHTNPTMMGTCETRYARAQQTGVWMNRWGGIRGCAR